MEEFYVVYNKFGAGSGGTGCDPRPQEADTGGHEFEANLGQMVSSSPA